MTTAVAIFGLGCALVALVGAGVIAVHAFRAGIGRGFLVVFLPLYIVYYAVRWFEHPRRTLVLALFLGGTVASVVLFEAAALHAVARLTAEPAQTADGGQSSGDR
jgi:translocator protein